MNCFHQYNRFCHNLFHADFLRKHCSHVMTWSSWLILAVIQFHCLPNENRMKEEIWLFMLFRRSFWTVVFNNLEMQIFFYTNMAF